MSVLAGVAEHSPFKFRPEQQEQVWGRNRYCSRYNWGCCWLCGHHWLCCLEWRKQEGKQLVPSSKNRFNKFWQRAAHQSNLNKKLNYHSSHSMRSKLVAIMVRKHVAHKAADVTQPHSDVACLPHSRCWFESHYKIYWCDVTGIRIQERHLGSIRAYRPNLARFFEVDH